MERIAVAISGGVDSLVAAFLLKALDIPLVGINFVNGFDSNFSIVNNSKNFLRISNQLGIPIKIVDIREKFKSNVVDYFVNMYCMGKTPSPCLLCNEKIKFGLLPKLARDMGASKIATGHYARTEKNSTGLVFLKKGKDKNKDQSYFLSRLSQKQLNKAIFPIGNMEKTEVIEIAHRNNLKPISNKDSQDICFVNGKKYSDFINNTVGFSAKSKPGKIINEKGKNIGTHHGLHYFTVGQRRGINCPDSKPYYVVKIDKFNNCLIVGRKQALYSSTCIVKDISWVSNKLKETTRVKTKIRYKSPSSLSTLVPMDNNSAKVIFDIPQMAVTPGQAAVFYAGSRVIGSGWIRGS